MIVVNDNLDERMPTKLSDSLVNFYPLDGCMHCKVYNPKYFRVLCVRSSGTELYDYFMSQRSYVDIVDGDIAAVDLSRTQKGKYNIIAIDAKGQVLEEGTLTLLEKLCKDNSVSIVALCNTTHYKYILGGQSVVCNNFINKRFLKQDFMQRSEVYKSYVNMKFDTEYAYFIGDGTLDLLLDTSRRHAFTISLDVASDKESEQSVITFIHSGRVTLNISLKSEDDTVKVVMGSNEYYWQNAPRSLTEFNKLIITSTLESANIYINGVLIYMTDKPIEFETITIGSNTAAQNSESFISFKNIAVFDEALSERDRQILTHGTFIMD